MKECKETKEEEKPCSSLLTLLLPGKGTPRVREIFTVRAKRKVYKLA
jgi:hypothetical protein